MFDIGSHVVYGVSGVCTIVETTRFCSPGSNEEKDYYVLEPVGKNGRKVFVPVGGNKMVLRPVMTEKEALQFVESIPEIEPLVVENDKQREEIYRSAMATCDCTEWVRMMKTLYERKQVRIGQGKQATSMDTRYWKSAEQYLYSELAVALSKDESEIEEYVIQTIEAQKGA